MALTSHSCVRIWLSSGVPLPRRPLLNRGQNLRTVTVTVVVCVTPPPVAVMVIVWLPVDALPLAVTVIVEVPEPGAAMEVGLKVTVSPLPCPDADKAIAELKPPETAVVIVECPEPPRLTVKEVGEAETVKLAAAGAVTVSETVVV